jgi:hypothetical protein
MITGNAIPIGSVEGQASTKPCSSRFLVDWRGIESTWAGNGQIPLPVPRTGNDRDQRSCQPTPVGTSARYADGFVRRHTASRPPKGATSANPHERLKQCTRRRWARSRPALGTGASSLRQLCTPGFRGREPAAGGIEANLMPDLEDIAFGSKARVHCVRSGDCVRIIIHRHHRDRISAFCL